LAWTQLVTTGLAHAYRNSKRDGNTTALPDTAISANATWTPDATASAVDTDVRIQEQNLAVYAGDGHFSRNRFADFAQYKNEGFALASKFTKYRRKEIP